MLVARPLFVMTPADSPVTMSLLSRRRWSIRPVRATALEAASKGLELETRIGRLEHILKDIRQAVDLLTKRAAAIQAEIDHLSARVGRR